MKLIVAIGGASGCIYGIRLLEALKAVPGVETHLVLSKTARMNIGIETDHTIKSVEELATTTYKNSDIGAAIASGSFKTDGMIVAACAMKNLSAIANSYADDLIARAADVCLKERRKLILMPRETPLHSGHLELMARASSIGAIIAPPMPGMYTRPQSVDDIINHSVGRILDLLDIDTDLVQRWQGTQASSS
ncbi:flavin prenyltransferase UbiX [Kordiimonas sediminis]|uniref:Flavin prenyltransferase UbiX n=1 Tax=Kordiimonas sediminis TaxID=1735581 RepID=A0A919E760_9PROT|nr:UbiX family flavin prenyltransferase [Kordiimonas sediminis]GHF20566.1 flavin prenyltransferase UbiX [Kordiimonas sediminis]